MIVWRRLAEIVAEQGAAALVSVRLARGSTPREAGARMIVRPDGAFHGSIGGGQLEWQALAAATNALAQGRGPARLIDQALGPALGQCCGGHVRLLIETFDEGDAAELAALADTEAGGEMEVEASLDEAQRVKRSTLPSILRGRERWRERYGADRTPLLLFGAGHVGRALVMALAPLPFAIRWVDSRLDAFPSHIPGNVAAMRVDDPTAEIANAPPGGFVLVMTHDHPLDLAVTAAALERADLPFVGLIGSATKRARFERRFRALGIPERRINGLACPIGVAGVDGKEPAVIAALVAAQLLQIRSALAQSALGRDLAREAS